MGDLFIFQGSLTGPYRALAPDGALLSLTAPDGALRSLAEQSKSSEAPVEQLTQNIILTGLIRDPVAKPPTNMPWSEIYLSAEIKFFSVFPYNRSDDEKYG